MTRPAVAVDGLAKTFRGGGGLRRLVARPARAEPHAVLRDVTFALRAGDVAALTGANGAGKSTLLRILATLVLPTSGTASIAGADVVRAPVAARAAATFVPADDRSFSLRLTGRENLEFFVALHARRGAARGAVGAALERTGLADVADAAVGTYSSGMRQRLSLARGLAVGASVLLLDEPFRALDAASADQLREVLGWCAAERMTVLAATHHLDELAGRWTRVLHLDGGRVSDVVFPGRASGEGAATLPLVRPEPTRVIAV